MPALSSVWCHSPVIVAPAGTEMTTSEICVSGFGPPLHMTSSEVTSVIG